MENRRRHPRFEIVGNVWGSFESVVALHLRDVSHGGALVHSDLPLKEGSEHHCTIACNGIPVATKVRVRWVEGRTAGPRYLMGLEFVNVGGALRAQMDSWFEVGGAAEV